MKQETDSRVEQRQSSRLPWITVFVAAVVVIGVVAAVWTTLGGQMSQSGVSADTVADRQTDRVATSDNLLPPAPTQGHPAPEFTLATLDGETLGLRDFQGKPVIINFWASWCGPCRVEMPHLQEAYRSHEGDVVVLGVNLTKREGDRAAIPAFVEEFGLTFPVVLDEEGEVATLYEVRGQPASVFVDANGTVQTVFYGPVNQDFIETQIEQLFES